MVVHVKARMFLNTRHIKTDQIRFVFSPPSSPLPAPGMEDPPDLTGCPTLHILQATCHQDFSKENFDSKISVIFSALLCIINTMRGSQDNSIRYEGRATLVDPDQLLLQPLIRYQQHPLLLTCFPTYSFFSTMHTCGHSPNSDSPTAGCKYRIEQVPVRSRYWWCCHYYLYP